MKLWSANMNEQEFPAALVDQIRRARHVAVLTGAGISAESGVPTFQTGFWAQYDPADLATPEGFERNPGFVWDWYAERRRTVKQVKPNPGHQALAEMQRRAARFTLITQNIDGLHQLAGSTEVLELHGNIQRSRCWRENTIVDAWEETQVSPPTCPHCGSWLRPDVVWFGEMLPARILELAETASESCDVFFTVGTSAQVYPAAALPLAALNAGATVVEINPEITPFTPRATYSLRGPAGSVLPRLVREVWPA